MSLIPIGGSDLTTFHTCLSAWELKTTLVSIGLSTKYTLADAHVIIGKKQSTPNAPQPD